MLRRSTKITSGADGVRRVSTIHLQLNRLVIAFTLTAESAFYSSQLLVTKMDFAQVIRKCSKGLVY